MGAVLFKCLASVVNLLGTQIAAPVLDIVVGIGTRALRCAHGGRGSRELSARASAPRGGYSATAQPSLSHSARAFMQALAHAQLL